MFSECTVPSNAVKLPSTNADKAFLEREFLFGRTAGNTWLLFQGHYYEEEPAKIDGSDNRAIDVAAQYAIAADSMDCFSGKTGQ